MNAADFLAKGGNAIPVHPVTVTLVDPKNPSLRIDAAAVLRFVPDRLRLAATDTATETLSRLKAPPSDERRATEEAYHLLVEAVRQESDPAQIFFQSVDQAKSMLLDVEALRLRNEYERYKDTHFPQQLSPEQVKEIAEATKNHFFGDLVRHYGYWPILRALPSLAVSSGASLMPTSWPTASLST